MTEADLKIALIACVVIGSVAAMSILAVVFS
jgi:hypothetical protein